MLDQIRGLDLDHPLRPLYDELDEINAYSRRHHHGAEPSAGPVYMKDRTFRASFSFT